MNSRSKFIAVFVPVFIAVFVATWHPQKTATRVTPTPSPSATSIPTALTSKGIILLDLSRVTKKSFGVYITPQNSPVQPEKFSGYHTGIDFETTPAEANTDIPVPALCDGKLAMKKYATGYGGVAVQSCTLAGQAVTIIYGHMKLSSIAASAGQTLKKGDTLGVLGKGYSTETDGERKHLHLGVHKGTTVNILGYVQTQPALSGWLDPTQFIK